MAPFSRSKLSYLIRDSTFDRPPKREYKCDDSGDESNPDTASDSHKKRRITITQGDGDSETKITGGNNDSTPKTGNDSPITDWSDDDDTVICRSKSSDYNGKEDKEASATIASSTRRLETDAIVNKAFDKKIPKSAHSKSYRLICQELYHTLLLWEGGPPPKNEIRECLDRIILLEAKYSELLRPSKGPKLGEQYATHPTTLEELRERVKGPEEASHPWLDRELQNLPIGGILYRVWDPSSRSKMIRGDVGFLSMGCDSDFSTAKSRKNHLQCHANWGNRRKTPFISTTPSIRLLERRYIPILKKRQSYKHDDINMIRLTAFNVNARLAGNWPILQMLDEIRHYKVTIPGNCSESMYKDEYLLPFRIRPVEIVADWHQTDIEAWLRTRDPNGLNYELWENEVVKPLYQEHERARKAGEDEDTRKHKAGALIKKLMPGAKLTNWYAGVEGCQYA